MGKYGKREYGRIEESRSSFGENMEWSSVKKDRPETT